MVLEGVGEDLVVEFYGFLLLCHPLSREGWVLGILVWLTSKNLQKQVLILLILDSDLEVLRNLTEHVQLLQPLLPAVRNFLVGPELKADECDVDEFLDTSVLLERFEEATTLLVLSANLI